MVGIGLGILWTSLACVETQVATLPPTLSVTPAVADLGLVGLGDRASATLQVTHIAGGPARFGTPILEGDSGFSVAPMPADLVPGTTTEIVVWFEPTESGYLSATLTVPYGAADGAPLTVVVRGRAVEPQVTLWPGLLDFGRVPPDTSAMLTLTIENSGLVAIGLGEIRFVDPRFSAAALPVSLGPSERVTTDVQFDADESDDGDGAAAESELTVDVLGIGPRSIRLRANNCEGGDPRAYDADRDGYATCGGDCNDGDATVRPGATESANGADDDCDGNIDDGTAIGDDDGDGWTEADGDCNDTDPTMSPSAVEVYGNGRDDDCDGVSDLGVEDDDGDGYAVGDCDNAASDIHPGATEHPDGVDEDCDGFVDDGTEAYDDDGDGLTELDGDCVDSDATIWPGATETPDRVDDDCDGVIDEGTENADDDGDGASEVGGDCDDTDPSVGPGAYDVIGNGRDDDCDGIAR